MSPTDVAAIAYVLFVGGVILLVACFLAWAIERAIERGPRP